MIRLFFPFAFLLPICSASTTTLAADLVLTDSGKSDYRIVIAADAGPSTQYAAKELQAFLKQISDAELPIVTDREPATEHEIVLGQSSRLKALGATIDFSKLGGEGYVIRSVGPKLVIAGGPRAATSMVSMASWKTTSVAAGLRPTSSRIPKQRCVKLGPLDETKIPVLEYREPYTFDCMDGDWAARNRVNSNSARLDARHGGRVRFANGFFVHTFAKLLPPAKYFATHPEYFSLVSGKRQNGYAQLCCTNEDVIRICTDEIRAAMRRAAGSNRVLSFAERCRHALPVPALSGAG